MAEKDAEIKIRISPSDKEQIHNKMKQASMINMSAYIRKMAIDGMIIKLNIPEIKDLNSLLRRYNNNLNQIAKRVNSTNSIYINEINEIKNNQDQVYKYLSDILAKLSKI